MNNQSGEPALVMVVDDDVEAANLHTRFLEEEYRVITAYGGEEALDRLDEDVDVVLLDRRMPNLDGDEVLREIRASGVDPRVVMVTAVDPGVDVISMEFDDYLVKPVSGESLISAVERMLARNSLDEHLLNAMSLASKMATLEAKMDPSELEESEEYSELERQFSQYRQLFEGIDPDDNLYAELSALKMEALFADG